MDEHGFNHFARLHGNILNSYLNKNQTVFLSLVNAAVLWPLALVG